MSEKSKKSSKKVDRPISRTVMAKAKKIAARYQIILEREDGQWYGRGLELPGTMADGKTVEACVKAVREAMALTVVVYLEHGDRPPRPASEGKRTEQVNIRLSAEERARIEAMAKSGGYNGISDYMREAAIGA